MELPRGRGVRDTDGGLGRGPRGVFTLYWPLAWGSARFSLIVEDSLHAYAKLAAPQIRRILDLFGVRFTSPVDEFL